MSLGHRDCSLILNDVVWLLGSFPTPLNGRDVVRGFLDNYRLAKVWVL